MSELENPFAIGKSDYLSDHKILNYFAAPPFIGFLERVQPVLLQGGRGTGKTMLLRYLSFEIQQAKFLREHSMVVWTPEIAEKFWRNLRFFGVYVKLNSGDTRPFSAGRINEQELTNLFTHFFNMIVCGRIIDLVRGALRHGVLTMTDDKRREFALLTGEVCLDRPVDDLDALQVAFDKERRHVERYLNDRSVLDVNYSGMLTTVAEPIEWLTRQLRDHIPELETCPVFVLLDEYENLLEPQQRMINTLIKLSSPYLTFKISMRHYGFLTRETLIGGQNLEATHDYAEVIIEKDLFENPVKYEHLLLEISRRRLEESPSFSESGRTNITDLLTELSELDEARSLVNHAMTPIHKRRFHRFLLRLNNQEKIAQDWTRRLTGDNPLLDRLNQVLVARGWTTDRIEEGYLEYLNGERDNWYGKIFEPAKRSLLFLLVRDYGGRSKRYCGFSTFAKLSSGVVRTYLELCERAVYYAQLEHVDIVVHGISPDYQTIAAERVSHKEFDKIPELCADGNQIQAFVRELGSVFRQLQLDPGIRSPEVTFFSTYPEKLDAAVSNILHLAVHHSIVIPKRSMNTKEIEKPIPQDFFLNRIFAPKFGISTSTRNRILLTPVRLSDLMFGDFHVRAQTRHQLTKRRRDPAGNQLIFDFDNQEGDDSNI